MNKNQKKILEFLNVKNLEDLIGKTLKVSFTFNDTQDDKKNGNLTPQVLLSKITSLTLDDGELSFPPITLGQGSETLQLSIFSGKLTGVEFHISIIDRERKQTSYYYSTKTNETTGFVKGSGKVCII